MPSFKPQTTSLSLLPLAGVRFLFPSLFLFLFVLSVSSLADEGMPLQQDENSTAISTAIASDDAGNVLSVGRRYLASPTTGSARSVGWLKLISASTGLAVNTFNSAGDSSSNLNESTAPSDTGSIYVDLSAFGKESLCTSVVWDSTNSVFWVACRSVTSSSKYLVYLLKVTTAGVITSYSTTLGNGTGNNYHGFPGRQGSLMLDDTNTSLVLVGYKGTGITSPYNTTNDYRPFIAKFTISGQTTGWAPAHLADFATTDSNSTTGAYGHRAVAVVKAGSFYYSAYTHLKTGGVRIAKFATSDLAPSSSGFFAATTFPSASVGSTPTSYPTSMAYYSTNSTTLLVGGSVRSGPTAAYLGFVMAVDTDGAMVTTCDTDGFNLFSVNNNTDTLVNDIIAGNCASSLNLIGAAHNGTNYKAYSGKVSLASNACSFDSTYGTEGVYYHSEGGSDTFYTSGTIDSSTDKLIVAGRQVVVASNGVFRPGNYLRSFDSCSSTTLRKYVNSCSMTWGDNSYNDTEVETGITGTLTFSDNSISIVGLKSLALVVTDNVGTKSGDNFTATAPSANRSGTLSAFYGGGANKVSCGSAASITVAPTTTTTIPNVVNVTSPAPDGSYGLNDVIDITVEFSSSVAVTGTPQLTLETGTTNTAVNYYSGSGTNTLTFRYTVTACNSNSDLDYIVLASNPLALNAGTIKSPGNVNASLTLPTPTAENSLGYNKALNIQGGSSNCY